MTHWSTEDIATLKKLRVAGKTAREIGVAIGRSRLAVIGRAHALKLPKLNRNPPKQKKPPKTVTPKPVRQRAIPIDDQAIPIDQRRSLLELERHHCRWPVGDPRSPDFFFCAGIVAEGLPYCAGHLRRAWVGKS